MGCTPPVLAELVCVELEDKGHAISSSKEHAHSFPIQTHSQMPQEAEFLCWEGVPHALGMPTTSSECLLRAGVRRHAGIPQNQAPSRRSEMGEVIWTHIPSDIKF